MFILFGLSVGSSAQATRSLSWRALSGVPHGRGLWRSHNLGTSTATDGVWTKYQAGDEQDPWQVLFFCYPTFDEFDLLLAGCPCSSPADIRQDPIGDCTPYNHPHPLPTQSPLHYYRTSSVGKPIEKNS